MWNYFLIYSQFWSSDPYMTLVDSLNNYSVYNGVYFTNFYQNSGIYLCDVGFGYANSFYLQTNDYLGSFVANHRFQCSQLSEGEHSRFQWSEPATCKHRGCNGVDVYHETISQYILNSRVLNHICTFVDSVNNYSVHLQLLVYFLPKFGLLSIFG